ncbi:hypothetical protein FXO38_31428 [Capsicum annuum]|nr:hypothetical protein FXO38_31428 [Capsicum annuum]
METAGSISKNYGRSLKKSINRTFSSTPCENLAPINYQNGILQTPILYHSFPPFLAHQKQPPLLPLPISKSSVHQLYNNHSNTLSQNRTFSLPPTNRKVNKNVKSKKSSPKKDQESSKSSKIVLSETSDKIETVQRKSSRVAMVSSTNPLGPDPKDLPKDVSMVLSVSSTGTPSSCYAGNPMKNDASMNQLSLLHMTSEKEKSVVTPSSRSAQNPIKDDTNKNQLSSLHMTSEKEQSSVVSLSSRSAQNPIKDDANKNQLSMLHTNSSVMFTTVSPPPSSLPLPTFSLRPKLSCNAEASAGVDAGATDNLRRLLRLR